MSKPNRKELEALRRRKANVKPREIDATLQRCGCHRRQGKGDHWIYTHPDWQGPLIVDPRKPTLLPIYVTKVVRKLEELIDDD